jgi:phenylacetate-coenzyme A ligase PaaK-like adenylate-forming protein
MRDLEKLLSEDPYSMDKQKKNLFFKNYLNELTLHHSNNSKEYKKLINYLGYSVTKKNEIDKIPFIPVRLFKELKLLSVNKDEIIKVLSSSGTSGNKTSKIYLDKKNSLNQVKVLQKIMNKILGNERLPMLIIDKNIKNIDRTNFNARIAAINGFSLFGRDHTFLLDEKNNIDYVELNKFLSKYGKNKFFIFGFTSFVFENLIEKFKMNEITLDFKNAILLHGGGWKKLENKKISNETFKKKIFKKFNLQNIFNYYGLVEQTGSIFIECKCGYFITSNFSDVLIRDSNFNLLKDNQRGFLQLISLLPTSYPGHNVLTEDIGEIINTTKCSCTTKGKRFLVHGRVEKAEIRGCSDTQ